MAKKAIGALVFLIVAACCRISWSAEDYEAKLRDVRYKKAAIEMDYKKELAEANQKGNADLETIKAAFHAKRDERIRVLKDEQKALKDSYETRIAPLEEEEKILLEAIRPAGSNFVKPKERKKK